MIGNRAVPDLNLPHTPLDQDPPPTDNDRGNNGNGAANVDQDEDEDDGDVAGPTVEAHVDLAKTPCEYHMTPYSVAEHTKLHLQYAKFTPMILPSKLDSPTSLASYNNLSMPKSSIPSRIPIPVLRTFPHFMERLLFILQPLPHSMLPVIFQVLVACDVNVYVQ